MVGVWEGGRELCSGVQPLVALHIGFSSDEIRDILIWTYQAIFGMLFCIVFAEHFPRDMQWTLTRIEGGWINIMVHMYYRTHLPKSLRTGSL